MSNVCGRLGKYKQIIIVGEYVVRCRRVSGLDVRIFSSAENFWRVALRMSRTVLSALPGWRSFLSVIVPLLGVTMN